MLINNQNEIVEEMFVSLKEKKLFNIPTGTGKTYIFIALAMKIIERLGKKVIISTSTNQLTKEFHNVAKEHFKVPAEDIKIQIGKSNYLDHSQYLFYRQSGELEEFITNESLEAFDKLAKELDKEQIFLYDFNQVVEYKDIASEQHINELLMKKSSNGDLFESQITFTNHFFLVSSFKNLKKDIFDDYVVLMDETHIIGEVAQVILSKDFSVFSVKIALNRLSKEVSQMEDFIGKEAIKKNIRTLIAATNKIILKHSNVNSLDRTADENKTLSYIEKTKEFAENKATQTLKKQLSKREKMFSREAKIFIKEISNIESIVYSSGKDLKYVNLSYTPSRGYPLLSSFSENPLGFLNRILWQRLQYFVGVSATICPSFQPTEKEKRYALARIGLLGESKEIVFYEKFFPKEKIAIYTPNKDAPDYTSVYDDSFDEENSVYHQYIVNLIHKKHNNKNTIVFCSGYKEAEYLASIYKKLFDDEKVHHANKSQTSSHTLIEFKKSGGVLFATRDYGTGVTLKGELLENIFILRLPYPITNNYKWEMLRKQNMNTFLSSIKNEMLITLMQWLGRLQRTAEDEGSIYLMDKRYFSSPQLKKKIDDILKYYGDIKIDSKAKSKSKEGNIIKTSERECAISELDSLLGL